jgi:hypothetical protein
MLRVIEDLAGDWRRLDARIEAFPAPRFNCAVCGKSAFLTGADSVKVGLVTSLNWPVFSKMAR